MWNTFDNVQQARFYCGGNVPVFPFIEIDNMDAGTIYPLPAQTVAEVWQAIIAGARGVQYFDQYGTITNQSYTGNGNYAAGAMYNAISAVNAQLAALAAVINAPFANGYVSATGAVNVMAKYASGVFWVFAAANQATSQSVTFTVADGYSGPVTVYGESRTVTASSGSFSDTFADANAWHIYQGA